MIDPGTVITDANVLLAVAIAFVAGVVSFASPCVVPLVPGYLSYMTGLSGAELRGGHASRARVLAGGLLFTLGFAVPFTLAGLTAGSIQFLLASRTWQMVLGLAVAAFGLASTGLLPFDVLRRERRITDKAIDRGLLGALPLGFVFGVGWTPCIGPSLGAILTLAAASSGGTAARGGLLAFVYALGLGLPFLLLGAVFHTANGALAFFRRNARSFQIGGGVMLTAVGLAIATGLWQDIVIALQPLIGGFETAL
jgi:cytochrome c-type biogenesis protein